MAKRRRGTTILELLVASMLLLICFGMVFFLFHRGRAALQAVDNSGGLQSTLLKLKVKLEGDFLRTALSSISVEPSIELSERDSVSLVGLEDWSNPDNFDRRYPGPLWNRRIVYVNGLEEESALDRFVVDPDDEDDLRARPLLSVWPLDLRDEVLGQNRVASQVHRFVVELDLDKDLVVVDTSLRGRTGKSMTGRFLYAPRQTKGYI